MATVALRKVLNASKLHGIIDLPEEWNNKNLNIYVAPVDQNEISANISSYFGLVRIDDPESCLRDIRSEIRLVPVQENISKLRGALVNVAGNIPEDFDQAVDQSWEDWASDYAKKA